MTAERRRSRDQALPRRVGRYDAFLQIGAGGMARVYLAVLQGEPGQAQLAVVKILRPEAVEDEHVLALFMDEARIAMRLNHPNVIRTREVVAEPPDYMLAMDFVNGQSLLQVLRRIDRLAVPLDEHIYILSKVLAGLSYAHELTDTSGKPFGVVHRDVSPANVLVSYTGEVKLLDFGIAKATGALAATQDGVVKGKLGYAAPEQCLGKPADPRSDIYAVGVMLWEAIAGRRRATGETWHSVLQARLEDAEPQLEEVRPDAPKALMDIARRALARKPEDRYQKASEFERDLEKYLSAKHGPKMGPGRIAAMLKPHFEQDRKQQQQSVEAFLRTLRNGGSGQHRRMPLPGAAAASPKTATKPPGVVEEEQTSRIPVDAALLIASRGDSTSAPGKSSHPAGTTAAVKSDIPTAPPSPRSGIPTAPPPTAPRSGIPTARPPTTPDVPPQGSATTPQPMQATATPGSSRAPSPAKTPMPIAAPATSERPSNDVAERAFPTAAPSSAPRPSRPEQNAYGIVTSHPPEIGSQPLASVADVAPVRKKVRPSPWPAVLVLAGAAGLAAGIFYLHKSSARGEAAGRPTPAAQKELPASTPATAPKVETVKVRISVDPADAVVKLDGRVLANNPFVTTLPRDNDVHELTAYAEGCKDAKQVVHLNQDVDMLVALKRLKGFARSTPARTTAAGVAARAAAAATAPVLSPQPSGTARVEAPAAEPGTDLHAAASEPAPKPAAEGTPKPAAEPTKPAAEPTKPPVEDNPYGQ